GARVGPIARDAGHREIPRLTNRHTHGTRSVDPVSMPTSPIDVVALTRSLVDIDSTTGREREAGIWLASYLREQGFVVTDQAVDASRFNVIASILPATERRPTVVLSTHFDCVPP